MDPVQENVWTDQPSRDSQQANDNVFPQMKKLLFNLVEAKILNAITEKQLLQSTMAHS